jgi:hypothetical protein
VGETVGDGGGGSISNGTLMFQGLIEDTGALFFPCFLITTPLETWDDCLIEIIY